MHILLDARPFTSEFPLRGGMYSEDLFQALFRNFPSDIFYIWTAGKTQEKKLFSFHLDLYPNVKRIHSYISEKKINFFQRFFQYPKIDDIVETEAMKRGILPWTGKIDIAIFLAPYLSPIEKNCLKVQCIDDISTFHFSRFLSAKEKRFHQKKRYQKEIDSSDIILTPSECVKNDIVEIFSKKTQLPFRSQKEAVENKISILGTGILEMVTTKEEGVLEKILDSGREESNAKPHQEQEQKKKSQKKRKAEKNPEKIPEKIQESTEAEGRKNLLKNLPEKYFFTRGIFSQLNNFPALLKAYSLFCSRFEDNAWKLVVEEEQQGDLSGVFDDNPSCITLPPLLLKERIEVLKKAQVFLYPSLYDGVGKPLLEAMRCGCAVVSSHFGALPEVYGNTAISFDPTSHLSLLKAMKKIFQDDSLRQHIAKEGKERSYESQFLWDDISQRLMILLEEKRSEKDEEIENK